MGNPYPDPYGPAALAATMGPKPPLLPAVAPPASLVQGLPPPARPMGPASGPGALPAPVPAPTVAGAPAADPASTPKAPDPRQGYAWFLNQIGGIPRAFQ